MRKAKFFRLILLIISICLCSWLIGCAGVEREDKNTESFYIYYPDKEFLKVQKIPYELAGEKTDECIDECVEQLKKQTKDVNLRPAIGKTVAVNSISCKDGLLLIDFSNEYYTQEIFEEILRRAAIVRTFMQFEKIKGVSFLVDGNPLVDSKAQAVGIMTEETFIDNAGDEINAYERTNLILYFANSSGEGLVKTTEVVAYNSNISMEKLVCEHIIGGPSENEGARSVNEDTEIISVNTKDGVCYVNVSKEFLAKPGKLTDEVVLFSFVNSLTELPNINKVQFMIDGETEISFGDHSYLNSFFERNLEIVQEKE